MNENKENPEQAIEGRQQTSRRRTKPRPEGEKNVRPSFIVGVGASAGGLEAFTQLLHELPESPGIALVLVQHLGAKQESFLASLLGGTTKIPVSQVSDGMPLESDHVYVIPPNALMELQNGVLHLIQRPAGHAQFMPVDLFFRSVAEHGRERAIGIILSGTGSDGSNGLRAIKEAGGITIAQKPESAKYDGMPRAAMATGVVDLVLDPKEIAAELVRISKHPVVGQAKVDKPAETFSLVDQDLYRVLVLLREASGVDFTQYKQPTIKRRLQRRMVLSKITRLADYVEFLAKNPQEIKSLYRDILIHVTQFFRIPESFHALGTEIFPKFVESRKGDDPIRIWVPGCATGEEAYSVAIELLDFLKDDAGRIPIQIFATDVSEASIETARVGFYPENITSDVTPDRLRRFFTKTEGGYRVVKQVRDLCVFARQDLTRDPPFSKLDLIVCRNVLIYLAQPLQERLLAIFHYALKPNSFLMLGTAETIGSHTELFTAVDKKSRIYRLRKTGDMPDVHFSAVSSLALPSVEPGGTRLSAIQHRVALQDEATKVLLSSYAPPGVIIDENLQIVEFRGQTGRFLEPSPGEATLNLMKMAREGLLYGLRSCVNEARQKGKPARKEGLRAKTNGTWQEVTVEVIPLSGYEDGRHYLVVFEEVHPPKSKKVKKTGRQHTKGADSRTTQLEQELAASREYMQSIVQDLEAANEELQSANEEILSANEELQSTNEELDTAKEELQSTNEELHTLNEELHARNEELSHANSDLLNLLTSVQIAIVIVGSDMRIRRFTPMAEKVLNLISGDIGRPISHIKPDIDCPGIEKLIEQVVDSFDSIEREVRDRQGVWYSLRIRPYRNAENRIDGAVLTLFDIDTAKRQHAQLLNSYEVVENLLQAIQEPMVVLDPELHIKNANQSFCSLFGVERKDLQDRSIFGINKGEMQSAAFQEMTQKVLPHQGHFEGFVMGVDLPGMGATQIVVNARQVKTERDGSPWSLLSITPQPG